MIEIDTDENRHPTTYHTAHTEKRIYEGQNTFDLWYTSTNRMN